MSNNNEKMILINDTGVYSRPENKPTHYNITFQNIFFDLTFYPEMHQAHIGMSRKDLILFKDAIDKELSK